jgi:uncharacterized membrane protein HdeD (DUF308 family)
MLEWIAQYWWAVVFRGVLAVVFGLAAVFWPDATLLVLVVLFGVYALVDGVFAIVSAVVGGSRTAGRGWLIVTGVVSILVGLVAFTWPGATVVVMLWLIATWALLTGVLEIVAAIAWRRVITGEWLLALTGVVSILFAIALVVWPEAGARTLVLLIGIFALVSGAVLIATGLRLRRIHQALTAGPGGASNRPDLPGPPS